MTLECTPADRASQLGYARQHLPLQEPGRPQQYRENAFASVIARLEKAYVVRSEFGRCLNSSHTSSSADDQHIGQTAARDDVTPCGDHKAMCTHFWAARACICPMEEAF